MTTHRHTYVADQLSRRDDATCLEPDCGDVVTRCDWSTSWPWECDPSCTRCAPHTVPLLLTLRPPSPAPMTVVHPIATQPATTRRPPKTPPRDVERRYLHTATTTDLVNDLTTHTTHHEPYTTQRKNPDGTHTLVTDRWPTTNPPLLEQLGTAVAQSAAAEEGPRAGFASKPAARIDALDALAKITRDVERWLRTLALDVPYVPSIYGTSEVDLRTGVRRVAAAEGLDRHITRDVRSWWIIARTVTGWDSAAWKPRVGCPLCEVVGGLRIRLDVKTAVCVECCGEWDETTIGLLADHISLATSEEKPEPVAESGHPEDGSISA